MSGSLDLRASCWPLDRLDDALVALAERAGLEPSGASNTAPPPPPRLDDPERLRDELGRWLDLRASAMGFEIEALRVPLGALESSLRRLGPALLLVTDADDEHAPPRLLALDGRGRLLGPDLRRRKVPAARLAAFLSERLVAPVRDDCERLLDTAMVPPRRRAAARDALIRRRLGSRSLRGIWQLRRPPHAGLGRLLVEDGALRSAGLLLGANALRYVLLLAAWWLIGRSVLEGRSDLGWLSAWALLLITMVPLQALQSWHNGLLALRLGSVLKRRMLAGALSLDPDELRERGVGRMLAMVIEAEAVEGLALSSGLYAATAFVDLGAAAWVLSKGAGPWMMIAFLLACVVFLVLLGVRYALVRRAWTRERLAMTHALVERMVGHTTRLAQEAPSSWHVREDASTAAYLGRSRALDRSSVALDVFARRGWMLVGVLGLWPALVGGQASTAALAVTFGGLLLARGGFSNLAAGVTDVIDLSIAWREVGPLIRAGARRPVPPRFLRPRHGFEPAASEARPEAEIETEPAPTVIEVRDLSYRYAGRERPALRGVDFELRGGERLLLEGPSGGGKSTFAAVLAGLRQPSAGLLLLSGLDAPTHGEQGWRERVAAAPQFHLNHILTNTFAFNLLMGRRWPPTPADLQLAEQLCRELGLGPLLERMPAGMQQNVGETGWQLSHGERSRVFLARALLQGAELVILDESFAALDPDNQALALRCAFEHAPTLLVIAHP